MFEFESEDRIDQFLPTLLGYFRLRGAEEVKESEIRKAFPDEEPRLLGDSLRRLLRDGLVYRFGLGGSAGIFHYRQTMHGHPGPLIEEPSRAMDEFLHGLLVGPVAENPTSRVPCYTSDIAAAMSLVQEFLNRYPGAVFSLHQHHSLPGVREYRAEISVGGSTWRWQTTLPLPVAVSCVVEKAAHALGRNAPPREVRDPGKRAQQ